MDWDNGEEEMTVKNKLKSSEGLDTNVKVDKSSVIVVNTSLVARCKW